MKKLTGNQSKLDLNKNGKLDSNDFKMLRGKMKTGGSTSKKILVETLKGEMEYNNQDIQEMIDDIDMYMSADNLPSWIYKSGVQGARGFPKNKKKLIEVLEKIKNSKNDVFINISSDEPLYKHEIKYGNGGGTGVSSETGFAEGTNADLIMNQDYLAYKNGGGVGNDWFNKGVGTNGLNKIKEHSKQNPKILFLVTDDNYSNIGSYYLLDGKFAKKTVANASYDLQKSKVNLKPKSDVIYKMKQLGDPNGYYENGGSTSGWCYSIGGL